jgi:TonB family protein
MSHIAFANVSANRGYALRTDEAWGKAFSYSAGIHTALFILLGLGAITHKALPIAYITDVKYVERAAPVQVSKAEPEKMMEDKSKGGFFSRITAKSDEATSRPNLPDTSISSPRGTAAGSIVSPQPLSAPIIGGTVGSIGVQRGSLRELAGNTGAKPGKGLLMPESQRSGPAKPVSLASVDVDKIRSSQTDAGVPMIGQDAIAGAMGGRAKELIGSPGTERKKLTAEDLKSNPLDREKWGKNKGPFSMEGPLKYRKILKMELPSYPRWAEEKGIEPSVSIRLWVDPKGKVRENMYLEKTSGYTEIDQLVMQALMKFVFVPLPKEQTQEDEWGVATFRFELKR